MAETKESLLKENKKLSVSLEFWKGEDRRLRREFTNILSHQYPPYGGAPNETLSWEEIFFRIGELNSDANYTILLEQKRLLERQIEEIKQEEKNG